MASRPAHARQMSVHFPLFLDMQASSEIKSLFKLLPHSHRANYVLKCVLISAWKSWRINVTRSDRHRVKGWMRRQFSLLNSIFRRGSPSSASTLSGHRRKACPPGMLHRPLICLLGKIDRTPWSWEKLFIWPMASIDTHELIITCSFFLSFRNSNKSN